MAKIYLRSCSIEQWAVEFNKANQTHVEARGKLVLQKNGEERWTFNVMGSKRINDQPKVFPKNASTLPSNFTTSALRFYGQIANFFNWNSKSKNL